MKWKFEKANDVIDEINVKDLIQAINRSIRQPNPNQIVIDYYTSLRK